MDGEQRRAFVDAFRAAGRALWVVGGALRDDLLGIAGGDEDLATNALPDEVEAIARGQGRQVVTVGRRFGTIGVLLDGRWSEVTTFRGDSYTAGTRWPDVTFGTSIDEDLARRDFTVNAIARDAQSGEIRDPYGGETDLRAGVLRAVGEAALRFGEDPLRILRGLRFASQLDFEVEAGTLLAMRDRVELLATLSQERVTAELDKLLRGRNPGRGLELLREIGALPVVLPELAGMPGCEQNRFHRLDVWAHTVATVSAIALDDAPRVRRWAAFVHDIGKPYVRHTKPNGEWGFYRHEVVGAEVAEGLLRRLKLGQADAALIVLLVRRHMDRPELGERRSLRRFMARSEGHWRDLVALKRADNASHTYDDDAYHDALEAACATIEAEDAPALRAESPLRGDDLVALFGRAPGPWIRPVKERLSAMVLDGDLAPGDRAGAERVARRMLAGKGATRSRLDAG